MIVDRGGELGSRDGIRSNGVQRNLAKLSNVCFQMTAQKNNSSASKSVDLLCVSYCVFSFI